MSDKEKVEQILTKYTLCELVEYHIKAVDRINKALKLLDSYKLGKYDYALTPAGLLELEDILRGDE